MPGQEHSPSVLMVVFLAIKNENTAVAQRTPRIVGLKACATSITLVLNQVSSDFLGPSMFSASYSGCRYGSAFFTLNLRSGSRSLHRRPTTSQQNTREFPGRPEEQSTAAATAVGLPAPAANAEGDACTENIGNVLAPGLVCAWEV